MKTFIWEVISPNGWDYGTSIVIAESLERANEMVLSQETRYSELIATWNIKPKEIVSETHYIISGKAHKL